MIFFFLASFIVHRARCKRTGRSAVEVNLENERFNVVCWRCRENLKFGNFTLSFGRLRQRIVLKCILHVQHDCFSSFNQSDHCFLASSLPLPWSLLKLPSNGNKTDWSPVRFVIDYTSDKQNRKTTKRESGYD